jgi:nucleotide-binding universal stress UspA family protein
MSTIQRVLLPIDLSFGRQTLAATSRKMFDRPNVEVVLLHVLEDQPSSRRGTDVERVMAQLEFLARKEFESARVCRRVERGRAADRILDYARLHGPELIAMPARAASSLRHGPLGHVTEEVLTGAPCAVLLDWLTGAEDRARHVCCAVRLDESDEEVLCRAAEVARDLGAELTIIHAVTPDPRKPAALLWDPVVREREIRTAQAWVDVLRQKYAPTARLHIEVGGVEAVVGRTLHRLDAGLLVAAGECRTILAAEGICPVLRLAAPTRSRTHAHAPERQLSHAAGARRTA